LPAFEQVPWIMIARAGGMGAVMRDAAGGGKLLG
jgi:hypothetical protein